MCTHTWKYLSEQKLPCLLAEHEKPLIKGLVKKYRGVPICRRDPVNRFSDYSEVSTEGAMVDSWLSFMHIRTFLRLGVDP